MPVGTARPRMTPARALFIKLMDAYAALEYSRTLLEVQSSLTSFRRPGNHCGSTMRRATTGRMRPI